MSETTSENTDPDDERAGSNQSKSQRVTTAIEFFREKFADANGDGKETVEFIDPKGTGENTEQARGDA